MDIIKLNKIGAITAIFIMLLCCIIFIFRLRNQTFAEYYTGILFLLCSIPLFILIYYAAEYKRPGIYYLQIILMISFIAVEMFLDYIYKINFRQIKWIAISYTILFFAANGGMIGIATLAGKTWSIITIALFFIMTFLAFFQRYKTGM